MGFLDPMAYVGCLTEIDTDALWEAGFRAALLDLDNTLVYWHTDRLLPGAQEWLRKLSDRGFEVCLFSNAKRKRTWKLSQALGFPCVAGAGKPWFFAFLRAGRILKAPRFQWVVIGDQLFTDVLGANLNGVKAIYVAPFSRSEWGWTKLVRRLETRILRRKGKIRA